MNKKGRRRSDRSHVLICHNTGDIKTKRRYPYIYFLLLCIELLNVRMFFYCCFIEASLTPVALTPGITTTMKTSYPLVGFSLCCLSDFLHLFINVFTCVCLTGALQLHVVAPTQRMLLMCCTNVLIHQEAVC